MSSTESASTSALEGRLPVLAGERIFTSFTPLLWTCTVLGSAIWVYLIGKALAAIGDIRITVPGVFIGFILGIIPPILSSGMPSFRYGVETADASKAVFGSRGTWIPLLGLLYVVCVWQSVITAFIAKGTVTTLGSLVTIGPSNALMTVIGLGVVAVSAALAVRGPRLLERVNNVVAPGLLLLSIVLFGLLAAKVGLSHLWTGAAPKSGRMDIGDHYAFMVSIEIGMATTLGSWPFLGGLLRLARRRRDVVLAPLLGLGPVGTGVGSAVAALMAISLSSVDPIGWFLNLGGPRFGVVIAILTLVGNIAVVGLFTYFASVALQQVKALVKLPPLALVMIASIPPIVASFNVATTLSAVVAFANYQAMLMVAISSVAVADYIILRRQYLDVPQLFVSGKTGRYWFWNGINWIAVLAIVVAIVIYLSLYNPATLAAAPAFQFLGASIPAFVGGAVFHVLATRIVLRKRRLGGYDGTEIHPIVHGVEL